MIVAHRASMLHFLDDPGETDVDSAFEYYEDGLLVIENGLISDCGEASSVIPRLPSGTKLVQHPNCLICPGFVDAHIHYPQLEVMASHGEELLDWLNRYTFPAEMKFANSEYAEVCAERFLDELLRVGTTTALVFGTVHPNSVDAFFRSCEKRNLRMISGKVMMDRNAPVELTDSPESSYVESKSLIESWHDKGRLRYAVTPRFAITSTPEQLDLAGLLLKEYPGVYLQTHLSENRSEVDSIRELFPGAKNYLDVYDQYELLGHRSVFAHCIHLDNEEWSRLNTSGSVIAHCPNSNLFLGSGLFSMKSAVEHGVRVGIGSDIGGGCEFSILRTLADGYKVARLRGEDISPLQAFYLATLGGVRALDLEDSIGNFLAGKEADFLILDREATPIIKHRLDVSKNLNEQLFAMMMLGDDRLIKETWIMGEKSHDRDITY